MRAESRRQTYHAVDQIPDTQPAFSYASNLHPSAIVNIMRNFAFSTLLIRHHTRLHTKRSKRASTTLFAKRPRVYAHDSIDHLKRVRTPSTMISTL